MGEEVSRVDFQLWVDFNNVDDAGRLLTLAEYAEPGVTLVPGATLVVGDGEGDIAKAEIAEIVDGVVAMYLERGSLRADGHGALHAVG